jgi:hypothetical protein
VAHTVVELVATAFVGGTAAEPIVPHKVVELAVAAFGGCVAAGLIVIATLVEDLLAAAVLLCPVVGCLLVDLAVVLVRE